MRESRRRQRRTKVASAEMVQFIFRNSEVTVTTIQADHQVRKYPHRGFMKVFESGNVNANFCFETAQIP